METKDKIKYSALATLVLKASEQISSDLARTFARESQASILAFGAEQYSKIAGSITTAYALEQASSSLEKAVMPKPLQGTLGVLASTIGVASIINYFGDYFDIPSHQGILNTTKDLLYIYTDSIKRFIGFNSQIHGGYLAGSLFLIKSSARLAYNAIKSFTEYTEKKEKEESKKDRS